MTESVVTALKLAGGVGLALLGMRNLSEALQAVAGQSLRKMMSSPSGSFAGCVSTGFLSTQLVQSSSIITVMAVGFVASSILTLSQALGVFIGANVGAAGIIWGVALVPDAQTAGYTALAAGCLAYFLFKNEKARYTGLVFIGIGLFFTGLGLVADGVGQLSHYPSSERISAFFAVDSMADVFKIAAVALLLTVFLGSSAAVVAVLMVFASCGLVELETAVAALFGVNAGAAASGWKAAIGGTSAARRAAFLNSILNISGSFVFIWFFRYFADFARLIPDVMIAVAATDTLLALLRVAAGAAFSRLLLAAAVSAVKKTTGEEPHLSTLRFVTRFSPVLACDQALVEVDFMKASNLELLDCARKIISGCAPGDKGPENHIRHREKILDNVQREVTDFLGALMTKRLPADLTARARRLLRLTDELESVSDECAKILKVVSRLRETGSETPPSSVDSLLKLHDRLAVFAAEVTGLICSPRKEFDLGRIRSECSDIGLLAREMKLSQITLASGGTVASVSVLGTLDIINAYDRMRAYYLNCAETLADFKK